MVTRIMDTAKAMFQLVDDLLSFLWLMLRLRGALAAEILFLRSSSPWGEAPVRARSEGSRAATGGVLHTYDIIDIESRMAKSSIKADPERTS